MSLQIVQNPYPMMTDRQACWLIIGATIIGGILMLLYYLIEMGDSVWEFVQFGFAELGLVGVSYLVLNAIKKGGWKCPYK